MVVIVCEHCKGNISVTQKRIKCTNIACNHIYHSDCVNFDATTSRTIWKCSSCVPKDKKGDNQGGRLSKSGTPTQMPSTPDNLREDTPDPLKDMLEELKSFRAEVRAELNEHTESFKRLEASFASMKNNIHDLQEKVTALEAKTERIDIIERQLSDLVNKNEHLEFELNLRDQRERKHNLEITGIPQTPNEDVVSVVDRVADIIGVPIAADDIEWVHRVKSSVGSTEDAVTPSSSAALPATNFAGVVAAPKGPARIILRFRQLQTKINFMTAEKELRRKNKGTGITTAAMGFPGEPRRVYLADNLTPANRQLRRLAKEKANENNYKYVWVQDCRILVRKTEKSKIIHIGSVSDLNHL
ncbi:uncharacterized protein LOC125231337 [Leguminivora glycinivorella]|uniref:uncharacterized protein LOC125231337 n=1 Tax=Leguminivora glycinivorella TaxID=1035111 RepID=UPI00200BD733|nr:uncharacterized protein LOC125231337 [Leguminivora glycinivorella]